jgi:hypothetical protein
MDNAQRCPQPAQPQPKRVEIRPNVALFPSPIRRRSHPRKYCRTVPAIERMCVNGTTETSAWRLDLLRDLKRIKDHLVAATAYLSSKGKVSSLQLDCESEGYQR